MKERDRMAWVTVYIKGRAGFQGDILSKLEGIWLQGSVEESNELLMFWVPESTKLRSLKMNIGSKLVFKHRLQFFTDLDHHLKFTTQLSSEFSFDENEMVNKMIRRDAHQRSLNIEKGVPLLFA